MYTPEQKATEKQTVFNTSSWTDKRKISGNTENKVTNISLNDLLNPQYNQENSGQTSYTEDSNSVYNPVSNLGSSVFGKDSLDYYLDQINKQNQQKKQAEQQNDQEKNLYMIGAVIAIAYLGYRFL